MLGAAAPELHGRVFLTLPTTTVSDRFIPLPFLAAPAGLGAARPGGVGAHRPSGRSGSFGQTFREIAVPAAGHFAMENWCGGAFEKEDTTLSYSRETLRVSLLSD